MSASAAHRAAPLERPEEREREPAPAEAPAAPLPAMLLGLQRSAGNQAVARMLLQRQADEEEDFEDLGEDTEAEIEPLGPEDWLEGPVVDGEGEVPAAAGQAAERSFEPPGPPEANLLQRSVQLHDPGSGGWRELPRSEREAFARARFRGRRRRLAFRIMADMASATEALQFSTLDELYTEVLKRVTSSIVMQQSQEHVRVGESTVQAFGYPFSGGALLYGPRVNYSARSHWTPAPPDNYARRTDATANRRLRALPRNRRHEVYGDMDDYSWQLTDAGKLDPFNAIMKLFVPQPAHRRTLIHCDYLISLVHFRSFAATLGQAEFNRRVASYGADKIVLRYDLFSDLESDPGLIGPPGPLASLQLVRPADEYDMLVGDHVYFFNHAAYDPLNEAIGNAWRLENALLIDRLGGSNDDRTVGTDVFLGHGSGRKTAQQMRAKLAEEYNDVVNIALPITARADRGDAAASSELATRFPNVSKVGSEWRVQGDGFAGAVDIELRRIMPSEVVGPHDPDDPSLMYPVRRPIESA
ncbi:MAG: hypothetical protein ACRDK0_05730 [Solirubrobacteraceae bacterium]